MNQIIKLSFVLIALGLTMYTCSSCTSQKKALRQVIKADVNYPTVVSGYCATKYPPKFSKGETITKIVQGETQIDTMVLFDTISRETVKYLTKFRVDTFHSHTTDTVENTALAEKLAAEIDGLWKEYNDTKVELKGENSEKKIWRNLFVGLATLIALVIGVKFVIPKVLNKL